MAEAPSHQFPTSPSPPPQPEKTGGRRSASCSSRLHRLPGLDEAVGTALADQGYAVEVPLLPGHGTPWEDPNRMTLDRLVRRASAAPSTGSELRWTPWCRRLLDGRRGGLPAVRGRGDQVAGVLLVNPALASIRNELLALPVLKHAVGVLPAIGNDIEKPDQRRVPPTPGAAEGAALLVTQWKR